MKLTSNSKGALADVVKKDSILLGFSLPEPSYDDDEVNLLSDSSSSHAEDANDVVAQDCKIHESEHKESTQEKRKKEEKTQRRDGEVSDVERLKVY